jgi:hypothetical protein
VIRKLLLSLVVIALLALALFITAPAEIAYRFAANRIGALRLDGVSGSVWSGSAKELSAHGVALGTVHWEVDRMAALRGGVDANFVLRGKDDFAQGAIAGARRDFTLTNVNGSFPGTLLGPALDIPALVLGGTIAFEAPRLVLRDGTIVAAEGVASWKDLAVSGVTAAALPGLEARFATAGETITGTIHDLGGPVAVDGTVTLTGRHFHTEATLRVREPNPQLEEVLKFIGERASDGGSILRVDGELKALY